jgi:hypothetical protein
MRQGLAFVALAVAAAGCGDGGTGTRTAPLTESLTFTSKTDALVAGTYMRGGVTLGFSVDATTVALSDSSNHELVRFQHNADGSQTMSLSGGAATVLAWTDADGNDQETDTGDVDGETDAVMGRTETQLAPWLSAALSSAGADGASLAVTLPLHTLAQRVSAATGVDPTSSPPPEPNPMCPPTDPDTATSTDTATTTETATSTETAGAAETAAAPDPNLQMGCQDLRNDPNCNKCLGMCGPGCTCWPWVCGDCCEHPGCLAHDKHCRACDRRHKKECILCALFDFGRPLFTC